MKKLGNWWNDNNCEIYKIEGKNIVLNNNHWNGENYSECFEVADNLVDIIDSKRYTVKPIYNFEKNNIDLDSLNENSKEFEKALQVVDYEIIEINF